jgi:hypothetical protein
MASKMPSGSSSSDPGGRPRAQVAYEGEDEFSTMSLDPERKKAVQAHASLSPGRPGGRDEIHVNDLKSVNDTGVLGFFRRIFSR